MRGPRPAELCPNKKISERKAGCEFGNQRGCRTCSRSIVMAHHLHGTLPIHNLIIWLYCETTYSNFGTMLYTCKNGIQNSFYWIFSTHDDIRVVSSDIFNNRTVCDHSNSLLPSTHQTKPKIFSKLFFIVTKYNPRATRRILVSGINIPSKASQMDTWLSKKSC